MTDRLSIRFASFVLAFIVTVVLAAGIDSLAQERHAGGQQMSQTAAASAKA